MRENLLIVGAAAALLAFPAAAQVAGAGIPPVSPPTGAASASSGLAGEASTAAPPVNPPVNPAPITTPEASASTGAAASTGVAANVSATESDLRTGAIVRDSAGVEIGKISKVTKGKSAEVDTQVTLSSGGKTVSIPASSLSLSGGALVTSQAKADIWAPK